MSVAIELPPCEYLRKLLEYDPLTGILTWRARDNDPVFNGRFSGKPAGSSKAGRYKKIVIDYRSVVAHRVIWKLVYGSEPTSEIDHVNGDAFDNRLANLRLADRWLNAKNRGPTKGRLLPKGVRLQKDCKNYQAYIGGNPQQILGYFPTPEEAHAAYLKAAREKWGEWAREASS